MFYTNTIFSIFILPMNRKLNKSFYRRPAPKVAKDLLGKYLVKKDKNGIKKGMITEVEAYHGFDDLACHGSNGKTERNKNMFKKGGIAYVYLIYGIHHCFNVVTNGDGKPSAVLVRALDNKKADGPGKLTKELGISKDEHNGVDLTDDKIWLEDQNKRPNIDSGKRINIDYAGKCANWPWRFYVK